MGKNFTKEQNIYACLLLMWFAIGIVTVLFFKFGHVLDHGKPIFLGIAIEIIVLVRRNNWLDYLNVWIVGSIAGLGLGSGFQHLTSFAFFSHSSIQAVTGLKWILIGFGSLVVYVRLFKRIPSFVPLVHQSSGDPATMPDGVDAWSEIEKLRYFERSFSEPIGPLHYDGPNPMSSLKYLGAVFLFSGLVIAIIPSASSKLGFQTALIGIGLILGPFAFEFGRRIGRRKNSKFNRMIDEIDDDRQKIAASLRQKIAELEHGSIEQES